MKLVYLAIFITAIPLYTTAQSSKNIYLELGGPGFFSANFDTRFGSTNHGLGARAGLGIITDLQASGITVPVGLNYLAGSNSSFLELGAEVSFVHLPRVNQDQPFNFTKETFVAGFGWLGYRYQPEQKHFTFRAGLCKYIGHLNLPTIIGISSLYPALSFGYLIH